MIDLDPIPYALSDQLAERTLSPALVVHLDHVRSNVRRMVELCGGEVDRWRPHLKTTKIPEVWAELIDAGVRRFKCATTREASLLLESLAERAVDGADVLIAYPLIGPSLERAAQLARSAGRRAGARLSVLCEDPRAVGSIPSELSIFVDVNPGMNRTGVPAHETRTILEVARRAGARFGGVHYYDGHLYQSDEGERRRAIFAGYDRLLELRAELLADGAAVEELITSGTPAFMHALAYADFVELEGTSHRISPGTVVFHDGRSEQENPSLGLTPAALVFSRVISRPAADIVTSDAGSKSIAAEVGDPCAFALGREGLEAMTPSEEHLPWRVRSGPVPERGEQLMLVPMHVCPTVNLATEALLMDSGELRAVVPVRGRGHEIRL